MPRPFKSLARQLIPQLLLLGVLLGLATSAVRIGLLLQDERQQQNKMHETVQQLFVPLIAQSVWDVDLPALHRELKALARLPGIDHVVLHTRDGQTLRANASPAPRSHQIRYELPLTSELSPDKPLGTLEVVVRDRPLLATLGRELLDSLLTHLLELLVLVALLLWLLRQRFVLPLQQLTDKVRTFRPGQPVAPFSIRRRPRRWTDELDQLADSFLLMRESLNTHLREQLRYEAELKTHHDHLAALVGERTAALDRLLDFQQLIGRISSRFINIPLADVDRATELALAEIGRGMQVERSFLIGLESPWTIGSVYEWCEHGVLPTTRDFTGDDLSRLPWLTARLEADGFIGIGDTLAVPDAAGEFAATLRRYDVKSLLMVRIDYQGKAIGLFGCSMVSQPRNWDEKERQQLRLMADLLANMIMRKRQLEELEHSRQLLEQANRHLALIALNDSLTGIPNRRHFDEQKSALFARAVGRPFSALAIDIDFFKQYNDGYGHAEGDRCLCRVATEMARHFGNGDALLARTGGEEFTVLLPDCPADTAWLQAEALRLAIAALRIPHQHSSVARWVTISIGLASVVPQPGLHVATLIEQADSALYLAKSAGRNRVASHRPATAVA
ncbi:diguanylate cyclase domain-containing protein [Pseudogulbenkiania sp. MAI-1]|uniref:diguanylate cyclase domain-containing protein n=1 Tax=Pseudogulbenkiania sp. MAI-1 TaxID=990370 RepID=UPI00045E7FFF|nr:diguanylate cyclase [Pseudogulbenkiania sp. MAI-1]